MVSSCASEAQLNRTQAGRVEIAKCYQTCTTLGYEQVVQGARFTLDALDGEWSRSNAVRTTCVLLQAEAITLDACRASCADIEIAYGVRSSHVRTRFRWLFNESLRPMRTSGLWTAWNRFPRSGTPEFDRACARYAQIVTSSNARLAETMQEVEPLSDEEIQAKRRKVMEMEYVPEPPPIYELDN